MVGKKSGRTLLKEEGKQLFTDPTSIQLTIATGLEKTDNNMALTSFPQVSMINQKNYYT